MRRLKRLVFTWLATARGGAEKSSLELCRAIRQRYSLEVELVVWHYNAQPADGGYLDAAAPGEVRACFDAAQYRQQVAGALAADPAATVLISNHRTYQIDLNLAALAAVRACVLFRESPFADEALRTLPGVDATALVFRRGGELDWQAMAGAAALIGISDFGARQLARFAPPSARIARIYNGPADLCSGSLVQRARTVRRFLIVARLIGWKAIDFGLEAFAGLRASRSDVHLQIAGDGPDAARLQQRIEQLDLHSHVALLGYRTDIDRVYQDNDCLLHLSPIESFGRVIVEANFCGLPAVVPQSAGAGELVINGHTGLTFRPGDLADCVRAMNDACNLSAAERSRLGHAAHNRAHALFNLNRAVEEYVGLADGVLLAEHESPNRLG